MSNLYKHFEVDFLAGFSVQKDEIFVIIFGVIFCVSFGVVFDAILDHFLESFLASFFEYFFAVRNCPLIMTFRLYGRTGRLFTLGGERDH